jgi:Flp pilus assembly protein TadD
VISRAHLPALLAAAALGCAGAPATRGRPPAAAAPAREGARPGAPRTAGSAPSNGAARPAPTPAPAADPALPPRAQRLFEEAVRAEQEQRKLNVPPDWPYLEQKWRAVLDAADVAEAHHNVAVALEGQGRLDDARTEYERARALKPSLRQSAVNLGVLLEKRGDLRGAAAVYGQAVRDFPDDGLCRERLAALYLSSGQLDDAWRFAREALVRDPRAVGAYRVLARVALQRNDLDLANLIALRAQKLDAQEPELPFLVGQVLARQGDDAGAAVQYRKALALRAGYLPARYALLEAALKKQAWGGVAEHAAKLVEADPANAQARLAHGLALRYTGKPDEALAAYGKAEQAAGDRIPEVHLARGVLLARVKSECEPALAELKLYQTRAGPVLPTGPQVAKLQRDCEQQLEENRKAAEAARAMQEEAARKAAEKKAAPAGGAAPGPAPTSGGAPVGAGGKGTR